MSEAINGFPTNGKPPLLSGESVKASIFSKRADLRMWQDFGSIGEQIKKHGVPCAMDFVLKSNLKPYIHGESFLINSGLQSWLTLPNSGDWMNLLMKWSCY
jgi:hypothetical protein